MIKIETYEEFIEHLDELPTFVLQDIDNRIKDWLASGGSMEDNYIKQQYRYAENVINAKIK